MAKTMDSNHSVDTSIHQLHEIAIRQQSAINSIQATLVAQQKDISNIRISINNAILAVSDLAMKLGHQITLPPLLPLFPTPPTPIPAAAATSTSPSVPTNLTRPDAAPPALSSVPTSPYVVGSSRIPATPGGFNKVCTEVINDGSTKFEINGGSPMSDQVRPDKYPFEVILSEIFCVRSALNLCLPKVREWVDESTANFEHKLFELMLERNKQKIIVKILFIFDPGGMKVLIFHLGTPYRSINIIRGDETKTHTHGAGYTSRAKRPCSIWIQYGFRVFYGFISLLIGVAFPFLSSLAGLLSGLTLPVTFAYPCFMWVLIKKPSKFNSSWHLNWSLGVLRIAFSLAFSAQCKMMLNSIIIQALVLRHCDNQVTTLRTRSISRGW